MSLPTPFYADADTTIYQGDARRLLSVIPDASVDLLFTDPPYPREYLDCYAALGAEAPRICKPGAFVFAYIGAETLPDVLERMLAGGLTWFWLHDIKHNGGAPRVWAKRLMVTAKPVLVFTNGPVSQRCLRWSATSHESQTREKSLHEWQQSIGFARKQIALRTRRGDLVLDPFMGSGTTLRAAKDLGRRAIGIDLHAQNCTNAVARLQQATLGLPLEPDDAYTVPLDLSA